MKERTPSPEVLTLCSIEQDPTIQTNCIPHIRTDCVVRRSTKPSEIRGNTGLEVSFQQNEKHVYMTQATPAEPAVRCASDRQAGSVTAHRHSPHKPNKTVPLFCVGCTRFQSGNVATMCLPLHEGKNTSTLTQNCLRTRAACWSALCKPNHPPPFSSTRCRHARASRQAPESH